MARLIYGLALATLLGSVGGAASCQASENSGPSVGEHVNVSPSAGQGTDARARVSANGYDSESQTLTLDSERTVQVVGVIDLGAAQTAARVLELANKAKAPIYLVINSPGGMLSTGAFIMDAMHVASKNGSPVECLVAGKAFSMAFNLLTACDEVFALPNAEFLFHPVRVILGPATPVTAFSAKQLSDELFQTEKRIVPILMQLTGFGPNESLFHYVNETMWSASDLATQAPRHFFTIVKGVKGLSPAVFGWPKSVSFFGKAEFLKKLTPAEQQFYIKVFRQIIRYVNTPSEQEAR